MTDLSARRSAALAALSDDMLRGFRDRCVAVARDARAAGLSDTVLVAVSAAREYSRTLARRVLAARPR